jgi:hypothetical protein
VVIVLTKPNLIVQAKDGGYVTVGWSQSNMSGDKTENKKSGEDFGLLNSNCALKISRQPAIPNLSG